SSKADDEGSARAASKRSAAAGGGAGVREGAWAWATASAGTALVAGGRWPSTRVETARPAAVRATRTASTLSFDMGASEKAREQPLCRLLRYFTRRRADT